MIVEVITLNPDQTDPKGAILSWYFAIPKNIIRQKRTKQKCLTGGKMSRFVYLACLSNPLKGPELSSLNLAWVQSSILWQRFLSCANILKNENKKIQHQRFGSLLLISINFDQETEQ